MQVATTSLPLIGCFDDTCLRVDPTSFIGETIYRMRHQSDNRETIHTFAWRSPIIEVILIPEVKKELLEEGQSKLICDDRNLVAVIIVNYSFYRSYTDFNVCIIAKLQHRDLIKTSILFFAIID